MGKLENATVLIIDDDADIRSSMRMMLEEAGFSIGEAGTADEGLKTADRIRPDAIIVDLMMESVDAGSRLSQTLMAQGFGGPIYLLSSAGDSVRYNLDPHAMGLAGIFQKPVDHTALIKTLKSKLHLA
jgi:FixJ family two-component response regulator